MQGFVVEVGAGSFLEGDDFSSGAGEGCYWASEPPIEGQVEDDGQRDRIVQHFCCSKDLSRESRTDSGDYCH